MRGFGSLFALQLFTRLLTFALNALLARRLGPAWYAFANVQLQLVGATLLFLPKEGLRRAAQRIYPGGDGAPLASGMNVAWLSAPAAVLAALLMAATAAATGVSGEWDELMGAAEARAALIVAGAAAIIEAASEPGWVYAQANELLPQRALAEAAALVAKAAVTAALVLLALRSAASARPADEAAPPAGVGLAFALGQLAFGVCFGVLLSGEWGLVAQMCAQAVQKYGLTEGERLVLVATSPLTSQGVYALVSNLGSLLARMAPQRLERGGLSSPRTSLFGLVLLSFGPPPPYSWLLLRLLYGPVWAASEAPQLLSLYCAAASAPPPELRRIAAATTAIAFVYGGAALAGVRLLRTSGLVLANVLNLGLRTALSLSPSSHAAHVVVGVACLGGVVAAVVAGEPELAGRCTALAIGATP
ncbi:hypothetical protein EMIHUDRAFT_202131 [Emiliania huxleyi CCMP1516]|uniref:Protein RFT1 homolog n=2 Tax=Emiliania huxleyi TaxID=2903 RepID=A0A0D3KF35_EMIH1|nr:hypothetical protein EMIHUDRAFT_202131 [Emiliania huxleyi CCMP1516]EOD34370.1 hypothetical protein EMIHUDRAFT_202131 [Emiliania huxleyi CCMP1516]|eukprot:XP_005786799.1 hypothetical protein EMIHUDRAFT_202131 [Emiliania huxleyi CCMP1516]